MEAFNRTGAHRDVIRVGEAYATRWKCHARFYTRLAGAYWGISRWHDAIRAGRRALAVRPRSPEAVIFLLASYRNVDPLRGISFGEDWLRRHGLVPDVCRHLSLLYDDLDRPAEALDAARRGFTVDRKNRRLVACLANYLAKVEGPASALRFAETHRRVFTRDLYCESTLAKGLNAAGAYLESERRFADLHTRYPDDVGVHEFWLDALYHLGRYDDVLARVAAWQRQQPLTASMANDAGRACLALGKNDDAIAWMKQAMSLAPGRASYADNHAITLGRVGRYEEAVAATRERLAAGGKADRRRLLTALAVNLTELGRHGEALIHYQAAFHEFPDDDEALVNVIVGFSWLHRYDDAIAFARTFQSSRAATLPARYWSEYAWALHQTSRFADEEAIAREWARRFPHDVEVVRVLNRALNRLDRKTDALAFARAWVDAHPAIAAGWVYLADQYEICDDPATELVARAEACRLAPDNADYLAEHLACLRRLHRAREAFDTGIAWLNAHPRVRPTDVLNRIGLAADDLEQWPVAESYYRQAHELRPAHGTYFGNLLRALICQNRATEAVELGRAWIAQYPPNSYVAGKQAWALRTAGFRREETEVLRRAVDADRKNPELVHTLMTSLADQQRTDEAADVIARAEAEGSATGRLLNDWANHLRDLERHREAEAAYRRALTLAPDNDVAAGNLASLLVLLGRASEAAAFCTTWLERRPDDTYVRRQLANAFYDQDDFARAEPEYRALSASAPDDAFYFGRWVACLRLLDRPQHALDESHRWLEQHPGNVFLRVEMGLASRDLKRFDDALQHYDAALALEPASVSAALRKLRLLVDQERTVEALEFGQTWHDAHPDHASADFVNELGIVADRLGQTETAERLFLRAVELEPANATFAGNAVEVVARRGRIQDSIQLGQRCLAAHPPNAYLLRRLADVYTSQHDHFPALDLLDSADPLDPADADVALAYLRIASDAEEFDRGLEFGRRWLARSGNERRAEVWARFARLCFTADHEADAFDALRRATELEPGEISHIRLRFGFWNALGHSTTVLAEFDALRSDWREDPRILRYVSRAHRDLGFHDEALALALRNVSANPADDEVCAHLAQLHYESGRVDEARACLQQWIDCHGEQPAVLRLRCRMAVDQQDYAAALADAEKVLHQNDSDEDSFVLSIRALRGLRRHAEARSRLHRWLEHQGSSRRIDELLDEAPENFA
jgi:Flp pilus assembly protein TadD, contains TPR repeats